MASRILSQSDPAGGTNDLDLFKYSENEPEGGKWWQ